MLFKKSSGFTLIEVLIAITLLAFIMLGIVSVTDNSINTKDRTLKQDENTLQIYNTLKRFEWDIAHLYSPLYFERAITVKDINIGSTISGLDPEESESNPAQEIFQNMKARLNNNSNFIDLSISALPIPQFSLEDKGDLTVFTIANRRKFSDSKEALYAWVRYRLESQRSNSEKPEFQGLSRLVRYFVPQDPFSLQEIDYDEIKPFTLLKNVKSLTFKFWNQKNQKFVDSLKESGERDLIRGIKMIIEWVDDFGAEQKIETIATPLFPFFDLKAAEEEIKKSNSSSSNITTENPEEDESEESNPGESAP